MIALQEGSSAMAEYQLYCFAQSGNAYRAALMLNLIGANWQPVFVDFFKAGVQRTAEYRSDVNEMGEVPVLIHGTKKLSQSGVILGLTETRIKIAQYLFRRQGMVVVLIARFVAVLRSVVGFIAGANRIISAKVSRNLRDPSRWRLPWSGPSW
jgi:Glutathione S-transferase, N-terminal domain